MHNMHCCGSCHIKYSAINRGVVGGLDENLGCLRAYFEPPIVVNPHPVHGRGHYIDRCMTDIHALC